MNCGLKFLSYVGLVVLKISLNFQYKWMFSSQDKQFSKKLNFLIMLWSMDIFCNRIIFSRKQPFVLKLLVYSEDYKTYTWQEFWRWKFFIYKKTVVLDFMIFKIQKKPGNLKNKIKKYRENPNIRNPPLPFVL